MSPIAKQKLKFACALGNQACRQGLSVLFARLPLLLEDLAVSHGDGSFRKRLAQLAKVDLLIQRCGARSTLVTGQLPVDRWHDYLSGGNPTVADAILDRLVSGSHRIELKGESMRKLKARGKENAAAS